MIKVLFVEDDADQIALYQYACQSSTINLLIALGYDQAHDLAVSEKPQLILLDLLLADEYGIDVLRKLRQDERTKDIPVVVFTNFENIEAREESQRLGAIEYIIKSQVTPREMIEKIENLFAKEERR